MKTINLSITQLILIPIILSFSFSLQSQIISGKVKTIELTTPKEGETVEIKVFPRLKIEKQTFTDENNNNILDANETAKLELKISNLGNRTARNIKINLNQTDENIKGLLYESSIEIGDLLPKETRDATLVIGADNNVPKTTARFSIEVLEEDGFNIPPQFIDIDLRPETGPFELSWESPNIPDTTVFDPDISVKININSGSPVRTISLFNNDIIQISDYKLNKIRNIYSFEHPLTLSEGPNVIRVKVENEDNNTIAEIRKVYYQSEKRLALVIGNSEYIYGGTLTNPVNDARAMSEVLQKVGFEVLKYENLHQKEMKKAIDDFGTKLYYYDVGLFYYAGHGIQSGGFNYLIPVESQLLGYEDVEYDCVRADRILRKMEYASTDVNVLILDACRDNPFERKWSRAAAGKGLAFMDAPSGSLIAYATSPGRTAADGTGKNGLYTEALLKYIQQSGLQIEEVFKNVRREVEVKSAGNQTPWESTSLKGRFYFKMKAE
jgi:hypothetical protein